MPIFEIKCEACKYAGEVLQMTSDSTVECPACGSNRTVKQISATSSLTGQVGQKLPGPQDTACCGSRPGEAHGCAGPGSCCGQR
jgi:putative FmdB family regulatory protein